MSKSIKPSALSDAIQAELTTYSREITDKVNAAGQDAAKKLKKLTKATAPVASGDFRKNIAIKELDGGHGMKRYVWHVKSPEHRITHLVVHGHATKTGGRTKGDPFLKNALDTVLPEYENNVKEALK